jgi:hypothetical protein
MHLPLIFASHSSVPDISSDIILSEMLMFNDFFIDQWGNNTWEMKLFSPMFALFNQTPDRAPFHLHYWTKQKIEWLRSVYQTQNGVIPFSESVMESFRSISLWNQTPPKYHSMASMPAELLG